MTENEFNDRLAELLDKVEDLPEADRERLNALADETRNRHARMKKSVGELHESLEYLRLSVKYLVFDLEATRRENQYLKNLIEKSTGEGDNQTEGEDAGE